MLLSELMVWWRSRDGRIKSSDYTGPLGKAYTMPSDIGLRIDFPPGVDAPYQKVVYALRREGRQCFCNLRLLTGLRQEEIKGALAALLREDRVTKEKLPPVIGGEDEKMHAFALKY